MNTAHPLVWFGHNLVTILYERSITSKFCSFRVLSQEFGGKSKKIGGHLGTPGLAFWMYGGGHPGHPNHSGHPSHCTGGGDDDDDCCDDDDGDDDDDDDGDDCDGTDKCFL